MKNIVDYGPKLLTCARKLLTKKLEVTITVTPNATPPPEEEKPRTISDIIRGIIQNPLNVTNSIHSANEIRNILTDNDRDNDQLVCDLIDSDDENTISNIREILNC